MTVLYCIALYYTVLYCVPGPCDEAPSVCARLLILSSVLLVLLTLPFSLCCVIKVVQVSTLELGTKVIRRRPLLWR